LKKKKKKPKNS